MLEPCGHADLQDQAPSTVVNELTSALALEASEKGGKLRASSNHWSFFDFLALWQLWHFRILIEYFRL